MAADCIRRAGAWGVGSGGWEKHDHTRSAISHFLLPTPYSPITIPPMPHAIPFRNRAREVSRIEAFSDVVFGFAISLLVVSLEAPKTYEQMREMLRGFLPFAICFWIFIDIWFEHHHFYKRYAMQDKTTMALNTFL